MIFCVTERKGTIHIVDYITPSKKYIVICGKNITKVFNTFSADNTFNGICSTCDSIYKDMYLDDLNYTPTMARNNIFTHIIHTLVFSEAQLLVPETKYEQYISKSWRKLSKIKKSFYRK